MRLPVIKAAVLASSRAPAVELHFDPMRNGHRGVLQRLIMLLREAARDDRRNALIVTPSIAARNLKETVRYQRIGRCITGGSLEHGERMGTRPSRAIKRSQRHHPTLRILSMKYRVLAGLLSIILTTSVVQALDLELTPYKPVASLSGKLKSVGSDTMLHEMELWAEGFIDIYPAVQIEIEGKGSNTAPPALLAGEAQLAPMSRPMTLEEIDSFQSKFGYKPTGILVAVDALAIYVNRYNPIQCLNIEQLKRIFAANTPIGAKSAQTWGDVGATGEWATHPIVAFGRNSLSGTHKFFKQNVLDGSDFRDTVQQQPGSEAVVYSVGSDVDAIGYSGIGYKTDEVRAIQIAPNDSKKCFDAGFENTFSHKYPLARGLYVYLLKDPKTPVDTLSGEFVKYVLSRDGQAQAKKGGYYPITRNIREHELTRLGLLASAK
jgi:phosphate transport system substrate-binding protein